LLYRITALCSEAVLYFVESSETGACPLCSELLCRRSWRGRVMIDDSGAKISFLIRRLWCVRCERIHHELPDIFVPYKRHSAETIEKILGGDTKSVPCENRTISRILLWWQVVMPYFINILKSLSQKLGFSIKPTPVFKEIVRAVANSGNWIFAHFICTRSAVCPL